MDKIQYIENLFSYPNFLKASFLLAPILFALFYKKVRTEKAIVVLCIYSIFFFVLLITWDEIIALDTAQGVFYGRIFIQSYTFLEYTFFVFLIWQNIINKRFKLIVLLASLSFITTGIVYSVNSSFRSLDSVTIGIETLLILSYVLYAFYEKMKSQKGEFLFSMYFFWIGLGILIYLCGSFFIYILANNISKEEADKYWFLTYIFEIIKNIFFAISIFVCSRQPKDKSSSQSIPFLDMV